MLEIALIILIAVILGLKLLGIILNGVILLIEFIYELLEDYNSLYDCLTTDNKINICDKSIYISQ